MTTPSMAVDPVLALHFTQYISVLNVVIGVLLVAGCNRRPDGSSSLR